MPRRESPSGVSVALCTYNGESFIAEQLESILAQSLLPDEIVVSDDGSQDQTLEVIRRVLPKVRQQSLGVELRILTRSKPLGVTRNFETATTACRGEFVALCDQDDVWHADHIRVLRAQCDDPMVMLAHSDARLVDTAGVPMKHSLIDSLGAGAREMRREQGPDGFETIVRRNLVTGATAMVRASLVTRATPFPPSWIHDHWLAVVATLVGRIAFTPRELMDYRQHGSNQIGVTRLTASSAVSRLGESRRDRHGARVRRIADLLARLDSGDLPVTPAQRTFVVDKLRHETMRRDMPESRVARWPRVTSELLSGRYHRLSRGMIDVVRDALSRA